VFCWLEEVLRFATGRKAPQASTAEHVDAVFLGEFRVREATLRNGDVLGDVGVDGGREVVGVEGTVVAGLAPVRLAVGPEFALDGPVDVLGVAGERVGDVVEVRQAREGTVCLADGIGDGEAFTGLPGWSGSSSNARSSAES